VSRETERKSRWRAPAALLAAALAAGAAPGGARAAEPAPLPPRPFVRGGIYDRPFIAREIGRTRFGGYAETAFRYEREEGVKEELSFGVERFNLFAFAPVSERVRLVSEIEFEEGGEEVKIELAIIDFEIHTALVFRGGILLSPLGRFNIAHDSPANEVNDRPLVSTQIIPTTLSEAGMGFYGALYPGARSRVTYEVYAVNGFHEGLIEESPDGTRIALGKSNFEDNNAHPSIVGRVAASPTPALEIGLSAHAGPYNVYRVEGLDVDERRDLTILAADVDWTWRRFGFLGEYAEASIDVPAASGGLFARNQRGFYLQGRARFLEDAFTTLPGSWFTAVTRYDLVDFDADRRGDSARRLTLGLNLRPTSETVFKLDYFHQWVRDRFDVETRGAGIILGAASYF